MFPRGRRESAVISVRVVIEKDGGKYFATAPGLPGLIIDGDTIDQIEERVQDGILVHLIMLAKNKEPLPVGVNLTIEFLEEAGEDEEADEDIDFFRFGNPMPHSDPTSWKKMTWPTQKVLETS